jgi:hypothetical protein
MTRERAATLSAGVGAGLLFATAFLHLSAYESVVSRSPADARPIIGAAWIAAGASLAIAALLAIAATPLFMVRRRALLSIAALTPLSIALLQVVYLGFIPPTFLLLVDGALLVTAGVLARGRSPAPFT